MWQMCAYAPSTLPKKDLSVRVLPAQLSTMFLLETFIHAKEKPTMVQWIELLTKQFNQCHDACEVRVTLVVCNYLVNCLHMVRTTSVDDWFYKIYCAKPIIILT